MLPAKRQPNGEMYPETVLLRLITEHMRAAGRILAEVKALEQGRAAQMTRAAVPADHGISENVRMSGMRYWSLSAIRVKPSIDDPSNQVPCLTEPSS